jgi:hypothetical protein
VVQVPGSIFVAFYITQGYVDVFYPAPNLDLKNIGEINRISNLTTIPNFRSPRNFVSNRLKVKEGFIPLHCQMKMFLKARKSSFFLIFLSA